MAKKSPPRGKLLKLKAKPQTKTTKSVGKAKAKAKRPARPRVPLQPMPPKIASFGDEDRLREAMEELSEARVELSRLGHAMTAAHRQIEDNRLSSASAREHLRSELVAVRTDLKTALAELEIARANSERIAGHAQRRIHELEEALARVRVEVSQLREPAIGHQPSAISPENPKTES
jgi:hypothetical protein